MKTHIWLISLFTLLILSCNKENEKQICHLSGKFENADSTKYLHLVDSYSREVIDTIKVENGKFDYQLNLEHPGKFCLYKENYKYKFRDMKILWLEPADIKVKGDYRFFENLEVTGSESHNVHRTYKHVIDSISHEITKVDQLATMEADPLKKKQYLSNVKQLKKEKVKKAIALLNSNANSYVTLWTLYAQCYYGREYLTKEQVKDIFNRLPIALLKTKMGKEVHKYVNLPKPPEIGDKAIDIVQMTPAGDTVRLSDFKGKYVLIDFWAASMGPCGDSHKDLMKIYKKFHPLGLEIISVAGDKEKKQWVNAVSKNAMVWTNISDLKGFKNEAFLNYNVKGIPHKILVDKNGVVIANYHQGGLSLERKLAEIFDIKYGILCQ